VSISDFDQVGQSATTDLPRRVIGDMLGVPDVIQGHVDLMT
jgi:hypothetical protein